MLYLNKIFYPHLLYGTLIWGSTYEIYLKKLATLQNKAVKIIGRGRYSDRAMPFYSYQNKLIFNDEFFNAGIHDFYQLVKTNGDLFSYDEIAIMNLNP